MVPEYKEITKEELETYRELILPMVYEELSEQDEINTEYICIASWLNGEPAGVIISELLGNGDMNLLSIWTAQKYRRMGIASALRDKMTEVAVNLYDWEEGQYGDDITLNTMYSLSDRYRKTFEAWLEKNDFTDFCIIKEASDGASDICSATAEIHFMRFS
ncbi:MAG: GNAT family N-acetyltransferase [Lachnospiraceae bacterium]|nr:GNAT family N-acetyltransferase [Lachnospiraceae bacterium]MBQ9609392.1 GNAT family N-acetyltransferase [Lachnospiraceae bacterium]